MIVEFTDRAAKKIRDIRAKAGLQSDDEVIKNAIRLYQFFVDGKADGCIYLQCLEDWKQSFDVVDGEVKTEEY